MTVSDPNTVADRQAAACVLVAQPLVLAHGPHADVFRLIRKHADWLIEQFSQLLGYRVGGDGCRCATPFVHRWDEHRG